MEKIWLKQYPAGAPAEIATDVYPSLVALIDDSFRKYRDQPAYKFMGRTIRSGTRAGMTVRIHVKAALAAGVEFDLPAAAARHVQVLRLSPERR